MFEYVRDAHLVFSGTPEVRKKTDLIVLHHSEGGAGETVESIHEYHKSKGHKGIDYNICVLKNGDVFWGRGLNAVGGHVSNSWHKTAGVNARSVGIVCLGNFMVEHMGDAQVSALKKITADVVRHYNLDSADKIVTHREIAGEGYTDCPGTYFPEVALRDFICTGGTAMPQVQNALVWKVCVEALNFRESPSLSARVLAVLHRGDEVKLDRYVRGENWARVLVNNTPGWVWLRYIGEKGA